MIEPNCDMPWDIYLDWLQDQGNEDLRNMEMNLVTTSEFLFLMEQFYYSISGEGDVMVFPSEAMAGDGYHDGDGGIGDGYGFYYDHGLGCEFLEIVDEEFLGIVDEYN